MAPWTHTYCSPQGERRLCCASREPSVNFNQYIDSKKSVKNLDELRAQTQKQDKFELITLEEHWNNDHMKSVRKRMLAGEELPECEVCDKKLLNTNVYKDYWNYMFRHLTEHVKENTDSDGTYKTLPISYDYRFSNLCNFKCKMCGPMLSSTWEAEVRKHDDYISEHPDYKWMKYKPEIEDFQINVLEKEFAEAIENKLIREIYWVGGEPLMYEQHWKYMQRIIELGYSDAVRVRYNTNLSRINYLSTGNTTVFLFDGLLGKFNNWQICASIDATEEIGEYIRTGLQYGRFLENFKKGLACKTGEMRLDLTITLPGLFDLKNMFKLSQELNVMLLTKVCFSFSSDIMMSPLALPKDLLHEIIDDVLDYCEPLATPKQSSFIETLIQLKERKTFDEEYDNCQQGLSTGKRQILKMESRRNDVITMAGIFKKHNQKVSKWWESI